MLVISNLLIPVTFALILLHGFLKKTNVYENFIEGAKDGLSVVVNILPTIIGLMVAVGILRASGALTLLAGLLAPAAKLIGFPEDVIPLVFMRLVSSSASTGLLLDIFKTYGPDSFVGRLTSVMMSCTETVFYTMSVYFMSVNITKTRYTLSGALLANFAGVAASVWITGYVFGR
jgi:spore maturation protein B